ncbi:sulfatase-like hydrolase/transferase [Guptibacillus hwajinpoensis]|uniref:sulfatase-like hydrolase/transferase n=1 Tax=Guptibacillus hwajinpoensis TaxID=208199 RepID=UPI001CFF37EA|nr:sulfatase-like hydrolase/transferase [Pseudalkalibacillus hwajinpoensis]
MKPQKPQTSLFTKRCQKPNFLILMVDQQRYPSIYESNEVRAWQKENLLTQELLRENGFEFKNHYAGSTACSPSRTTLYTGQYPSLHGVTQTSGAAKTPFDPDIFWLDPNTVPTIGDYLRKAGYQTYWKGKWHASDEDIMIPGTNSALPSYTSTGVPDKENVQEYLEASRLNGFGFNGWIGPEPHGANPRNSGSSAAVGMSGRDIVYAAEVVELLQKLEREETVESPPWMIMSSFINPHDIALYGVISEQSPLFNFEIDPSVPFVPEAPTADEDLTTKPAAQRSYKEVYPKALQPLIDTPYYRKLYYSLQKQADNEMMKVFRALKESKFYQDTIVLFLSDHGELLGAHGELYQKWYNVYEESIHVPLIIHSPALFSGKKSTTMLTSHVDVLPTMLGLAGIDEEEVQELLSLDHTEVRPLVGRDLTPLLSGRKRFYRANEPLYLMTDDDVTRGLNQVSATGKPYESVVQPNHIEAVITTLQTGSEGRKEVWKYARYYDNPQFWSNPGVSDVIVSQTDPVPTDADEQFSICVTTTKTTPVPDEFEMYNLTLDPLEEKNLAHPHFETQESKAVQKILNLVLEEQCRQKRLSPTSGAVPGMPRCEFT